MPREEKSKLDYFIDRTDVRLDELNEKIDRLAKFGALAVLLCAMLSPKGDKIFEMIPKLLEAASAMAGGK